MTARSERHPIASHRAARVMIALLASFAACGGPETPTPVELVEATLQPGDYHGVVRVQVALPAGFRATYREEDMTRWGRREGDRRFHVSLRIRSHTRDYASMSPCARVIGGTQGEATLRSREELQDGYLAICEDRLPGSTSDVFVFRQLTSESDVLECVAGTSEPSARELEALHAICRSVSVTGHVPADLTPAAPGEALISVLGAKPALSVKLTFQLPAGYAAAHVDEAYTYARLWSAPYQPTVTLVDNDDESRACIPSEWKSSEILEDQVPESGRLTVCKRQYLDGRHRGDYAVYRAITTRRGNLGCFVTLSARATLAQVQQMADVCRSVVVTELPPEPANRAQPRAGSADTPAP